MNTIAQQPAWPLSRVRKTLTGSSELSPADRIAFKRACSHVARLWELHVGEVVARYGTCEATLTFDCRTLNGFLGKYPAKALGLEPSSYNNFLSDLRRMLRALGLHHPVDRGSQLANPGWAKLYRAIPTAERCRALIGFLRFCEQADIEPPAVDGTTLSDFEIHLEQQTICDDVAARSRVAASNWNWLAQNAAGWPEQRLIRPRMRDEYLPPLEQYPAPFVLDAEDFLADLSAEPMSVAGPVRIFSADPDARPPPPRLAPATVKSKRWLIRLLAGAQVHAGYPKESFQSLRDLVDPIERACAGMEFLAQRHLTRVREATASEVTPRHLESGQLALAADLMRQIALHRYRLPEKHVNQFKLWRRQVSPKQSCCMTDRNASLLRPLMAQQNCRKLLDLPKDWFKEANARKKIDDASACLAMYATALELATACPIRRTDLLSIRLGVDLQADRDGNYPFLVIRVSKSKRRNLTIEFPLTGETSARLKTYVGKFRHHLATSGNDYLFPGKDGPREASHFATQLSLRVEKELGTGFNLHVMRHFAVWRHLRDRPNEMEIMRQVLGHASVETTRKFYAGLNAISSARAFGKILEEGRAQARFGNLIMPRQPRKVVTPGVTK